MKSQVQIFAANVRNTTRTFAESLVAAGVKVKSVRRLFLQDVPSADAITVRGKGRFDALLRLNYELGHFEVSVYSKRGTQMKAVVASHHELSALFKVWNIASY
jgi:hypothetical protein